MGKMLYETFYLHKYTTTITIISCVNRVSNNLLSFCELKYETNLRATRQAVHRSLLCYPNYFIKVFAHRSYYPAIIITLPFSLDDPHK